MASVFDALASPGNGDLAHDAPGRYGSADDVHAGNGDLANAGIRLPASGAAPPGPEQPPVDPPVEPPAGPSAAFTYSPPSPSTQDTVTFDASASQPGGGETITGYAWLFNNQATRSGVTCTWRLPSGSGDYDATLTVTDTGGQTDSTSKVISI
jgi:hypothetical protein